ncbi:MAG: DUF72 domain-containing protein [Chitinispirillaceae bacterium]
MTEKSPALMLGTSGWTYDHWKEVFYPSDVPKKRWFEYFSRHFDTVEINASFYRIPTSKVTQGWADKSPDKFRFAVKVSRLISHVKKLRNCEHELEWFFSSFEPLKKKVAVYLIQLPPSLKYDPGRLAEFLDMLPQGRYAVEFRNTSWYNDEIYELLSRKKVAFCIHDMPELQTEKIVTADSVYLRFHGYFDLYGGDYPDSVLKEWASWIRKQHSEGKDVYGYFNNDLEGFAVKNCRRLKELLG